MGLLVSTALAGDPEVNAGALGLPSHFRSMTALGATDRLAISLSGGLFIGGDFIYPRSSASLVTGAINAGVAVAGPLDAFLSVSSGVLTSSAASPTSIGSGTQARVGARLRWELGLLSLAGSAAVLWSAPFASDGQGIGLGFGVWALASADFSKHSHVPLAIHGFGGFRSDAGSNLSAKRYGQFFTTAQELWQYDVVELGLSVDVPLGRFTPFVEYTVEVPVGRGAPVQTSPHRLTPGARVTLPFGLFVMAGVELGLTPQAGQGVPTAPTYLIRVSVGWAGVQRLGAPEPELPPQALPTPPPLLVPPPMPQPSNDRDHDGTPDETDACPDQPGAIAAEGCPEYKEIVVTSSKIELKQRLYFAFGKTVVLPKSFPLLDEVVQALTDRPHVCIRIEGHTDNVGAEAANLALSQGRADAIREYCEERSIAAWRMTAQGYGSSLPLETNATIEGREANRRVEFVLVPCGPPGDVTP